MSNFETGAVELNNVNKFNRIAAITALTVGSYLGVSAVKAENAQADTVNTYACTDAMYPTDLCENSLDTGVVVNEVTKDDGTFVRGIDYGNPNIANKSTQFKSGDGLRTFIGNSCTWQAATGYSRDTNAASATYGEYKAVNPGPVVEDCAKHDNPTPTTTTGGTETTTTTTTTTTTETTTTTNETTDITTTAPTSIKYGGITILSKEANPAQHLKGCVTVATLLPGGEFGFNTTRNGKVVFNTKVQTLNQALKNFCKDVKITRSASARITSVPRRGAKLVNYSATANILNPRNDFGKLHKSAPARLFRRLPGSGRTVAERITSTAVGYYPETADQKVKATKVMNLRLKLN